MPDTLQILGSELVLTPPIQDFDVPIITQRRNTITAAFTNMQLLGKKHCELNNKLMNHSQNTDVIATNEFKALSNSIKLSVLNARVCE